MTDKEKVIEMFCSGKTGKIIAKELNLAKKFVDTIIKAEIERIKAISLQKIKSKSKNTTAKLIQPTESPVKRVFKKERCSPKDIKINLSGENLYRYLEVRKLRGLPAP